MKDGICLKCNSEEVYVSNAKSHGVGVFAQSFLPAHTKLFVCAECIYLEFYIENKSDLQKVREKFRKVKK